jgi:hypothetical protein
MAKSEATWSFKEMDQDLDSPKGTAFLAFKQLKEGFDEGRDFYYLSAAEDAVEIEQLRTTGRIYTTTVNAVLLTQTGYDAVIDYLNG